MPALDPARRLAARNRRTMAGALLLALAMVGGSFASVPLYQLYCRVTGFGGTTQVAERLPGVVSERTVTVRFNADTNPALPWEFRPLDKQVVVHLGEQGLTSFAATNRATTATVGAATYNVTPEKAGLYFNKIACFCFDEQILAPGQRVEMPVTFFVDPKFADDPDLQDTRTITLSYTFFRAKDEAKVLAHSASADTLQPKQLN